MGLAVEAIFGGMKARSGISSRILMIIALTAMACNSLVAQGRSVNRQQPRLKVSISPLALLDASGGPAFRGAGELYIAKGFSWQAEISKYVPRSQPYLSIEGYRFRSDLRRYGPAMSDESFFIGISYMRKGQDLLVHGWMADTINDVSLEKEYGVKKLINAFCITGGWVVWNKRFFVELDWYAGVRFRDAKRSGLTEFEEKNFAYSLRPSGNAAYMLQTEPGRKVYPDVNFSLRLGMHKFKKR